MMQWIFESAGGRKMLLGVLGLVAVTVLALAHVIEGAVAVETIKWIIIGVAGALAVSDIGKGLASNGSAPPPPTPPQGGTSNGS